VNLAALDLERNVFQGDDPWKFFGYILKLKNDIVLHDELLGLDLMKNLFQSYRIRGFPGLHDLEAGKQQGEKAISFLWLRRTVRFRDIAIDILVALEAALHNQVEDVFLIDLLDFQEHAGHFTGLGVVKR
jgi:hypothetical protein